MSTFSDSTFSQNLPIETTRILTDETVCTELNFSSFKFRDDSQDLVSSEVVKVFYNVVVVIFPILFFIGFPSNIVNLTVFFKHGLKQRINLCLFCLSLMDVTFVSLAVVFYFEKYFDQDLAASFRKFGRFGATVFNSRLHGLYSGSAVSSQFVSAVIAGERCLCVVWPLRSSALLKTKTLGLTILFGSALIFSGRFVVAMKHRAVCVVDASTGFSSYFLTSSQFYQTNKKALDIVDGVVYSLVLNVFFCVFVGIATILTAANLQKSSEFQKESSSAKAVSDRNVRVTKMLIYLSVQFVVLNTPNMLFRVSLVFLPQFSPSGDWANLFFFLGVIPQMCAVLSSSLNFLVYYFFGSKYRETVLEMFYTSRVKR